MKSKLLILFLAISSIYLSAQCPRQTAVDNYHNQYLSANFTDAELNWTGNIINCTQGTMSATVLAKHLQKINYYRNLVGLESVILNDIKNQKALASVLMFEAENTPSPPVIQLTHCDGANNAPCNQYPCNSADGIEATKNSNLAFASPNWNNQGPIDVYMQDEGDSNQDVIHRRWILHSKAQDIGIASSTRFNAMYVIDGLNNPSVYNEFIAYPPSGYMPQPLVPSRWSFGIPAAIFSNATVTMQDPDGNTIPLTIISNNQNGFADNSIVWEPSGIINNSNMDVAYTITISNISNAAQSSYTYTTNIIPTSHPPFCPNEQVWSEINCQCEAAPPPCPTEPLMISTNGNTCALHPLNLLLGLWRWR